jgi:DNA-binding GntR family transcriptional regulator
MLDQVPLPELSVAPSLRQQLVDHLREQIINGELTPGTTLAPATLAKRLGTSATPVRDALRLLEQEGLVEVSARRFSRVAAPRREVADEAYPLLGVLEAFVLRESPPDAGLVRAMDEANRIFAATEIPVERLRADIRFHRALSALARPMTHEMLLKLYGRIVLFEAGYHRSKPATESIREHSAILDALGERDLPRAGELVERHWLRGYAAVIESTSQAAHASSRPASPPRRSAAP